MYKHTPKLLARALVTLCITLPLVASASWWNPVSWFGGWFGLFHTEETAQVVTETATSTDTAAASSSPEVSGGGSFFSRAKPKPSLVVPPPNPPATPTSTAKNPTPAPSPRPSVVNIPPAKNPTPTPAPQPKPNTSLIGRVSFSGEIRVPKRTSGTATSSNTMYIWFPTNNTRITVKETAVSGITFKPGTCKAIPCTTLNVASVASSVKEGTYPVSVTITSGTSTAQGTFSIVVLPPEPIEVRMTISGPVSVKKNSNGSVSGSNTVNIQLVRGTPEKLTLTQSEFPDGVTGRASLGTCLPPCKITNSVSITSDAESGQFPMVIHATGGSVNTSVSYNLNIGYSSAFGMHFDGEKRTYTQNQNPTALITMDYPFDLLLDGGTPERATFEYAPLTGSTSVRFSQSSCLLPCKGLVAHIQMLENMKVGTVSLTLKAVVNRQEDDGRGGTKTVKYTESRTIPIKIVPLALPY